MNPNPPATLSFQIPAMSCGHCVRAITEAVRAADPEGQVTADLALHQVQISSGLAREALVRLLTEADYPPG
jgi:copper chaperone